MTLTAKVIQTYHTKPEISIIIPAFNEEHRLPSYLQEVINYSLKTWGAGKFEILVIDDGSKDLTQKIAEQYLQNHGAVIRLEQNQGKGAALRCGFKNARGILILFTDADGATPIAEEAKLRFAIKGGFDLAISSRSSQVIRCILNKSTYELSAQEGNGYLPRDLWQGNPAYLKWLWHLNVINPSAVKRPMYRRITSAVLQILQKTVLRISICDSQCGFKMFNVGMQQLFNQHLKVNNFAIDLEMLYIASLCQAKIVEIPVTTWKDIVGSKVSILRDSSHLLRTLFFIKNMHKNVAADTKSVSGQKLNISENDRQ